jgi:signal transduction histidine kinase
MKKLKTHKDLLGIYIEDSSIGIKKEDQEKLFNKFRQIFSEQYGRPQGSGLGLYISKLIARKMSGDVWLEKSDLNRGSTFAFSLPLAKMTTLNQSKLQVKNKTDQNIGQKLL